MVKYFVTALAVVLLFTNPTSSSEDLKIENAILHILKNGVKTHKIKPCPAHPLVNDNATREQIASAIKHAAQEYDVPPMLLVATAFREGRFLNSSVGKIGERSTFQMVEQVVEYIQRIESRCSLDTIEGSSWCAAAWLSRCRSLCGDLRGAVVAYVTGKYCEPKTERLKWIANDRTRLADFLESL